MASAASCRLEGFASHSVSFVRSFVLLIKFVLLLLELLFGFSTVFSVFVVCRTEMKNAAASEF